MGYELETSQLEEIKQWHFLSPHMKATYMDQIDQIEKSIAGQELRITVFGEFSSGKSTFLNALVGKDILPHEMTETTATITYIHNVPENDERLDTITVDFVEGQERTFKLSNNQQTLRDYLTTKSNVVDVATAVRSVHIYCHMFDSDHRLVLVDTPGLNGMKEHHRDITIDELRRSHISICMFNQKGLMESEVPNLRELLHYQREFIFVMNFLDRLSTDEGDSAESQLDMLRQQLTKHVPDIEVREENIFIISALYALAGRDKNIKRLYHGDEEDLTAARRAELVSQSRITALENYLKTLSEEKFSAYLAASLRYKIIQLVKHVENEADYYQTQVSIQQEDGQKQLNLIQAEISKRQDLFESRKKDLYDFISQKCLSISQALKKKLDKDQENWLESNIRQIENMDMEDARAIQGLIYQVNQLAVSHHREYREKLKDMLTAIYRDGILKADAYYPAIKEIAEQQASFELKQNIQTYSYTDELAKYDEAIERYSRELAKAEQEDHENNQALIQARRQLSQAKTNRELLQQKCNQDLANMGERPDIDKRPITRTREENRTFFGIPIPFTSKTVTYTDYVDDTTRRDEWDEQRKKIQYESRGKLKEYDDEICTLERKIKSAECDNDGAVVQKYQKKLEDAKKIKQQRLDEINELKKQARQEFFKTERKRLIKSLREYRVKHFDILEEEIKQNFEIYKPQIWERILKHYTKVYGTDTKRLQKLLDGYNDTNIDASVEDINTLQQEITDWWHNNEE